MPSWLPRSLLFADSMTVIATAGHVDHGKSSLVQAITGTNPDRLAEEQRRSMTIDLGFAHVITPRGHTLSFIDVPGHADFVRTMVSGVSGVDIALLVVDALEGWKQQTEEHLGILEVLGITRGVVALTKSDKVDAITLADRVRQISARLDTTTITWSTIVPTSVIDNNGIDALVRELEELVASHAVISSNRRPRLFIDRVFSMTGAGTIVTGTLDGAELHVGTDITIARTSQHARIREIQTHGEVVTSGQPGTRCAINLVGVDTNDVQRGDALVVEDDWWSTNIFDAQLTTLSSIPRAVTKRGSFTVHIGTNSQSASMRVLSTDSIDPGNSGTVRIRLSHPLPLVPGDRFLLRDTGVSATIGGGVVLDVDPRSHIRHINPDGDVNDLLAGRGWLTADTARRLTGKDVSPVVGDWVTTPESFADCQSALSDRLTTEITIDISTLAPHERDVLLTLEGVSMSNGLARRGTDDPLLQHPYVEMFRDAGVVTPETDQLDRNVMRQLIQTGTLFEHDGIAFHRDTLESLRPALTQLWQTSPSGFTVSQLREALTITRKHAIPLVACLDKIGFTRRTGDTRTAGSRW